MEASSEQNNTEGRRKRQELLQYYDKKVNSSSGVDFSLDLQSEGFDAKIYAEKLIKECSLKQLLEEEASLLSTSHRLDSDCQTLVYEHYDKFLHATDLVHKLKEGSSEMEAQLKQLQANMTNITSSSAAVTSGLKERRESLSRLVGAHTTLQKLEFLFQLPQNIDDSIKTGNMQEGVECYLSTCSVLHRYQHLSSLEALQKDCDAALDRLKSALHSNIAKGNPRELALCVELLLKLGEPRSALQESYLQQARTRLLTDMVELEQLVSPVARGGDTTGDEEQTTTSQPEKRFTMDLLLFIDRCHETYVANLWLLISSYQEMFLAHHHNSTERAEAQRQLCCLVDESITALLTVVRRRVTEEVQLQPLHCNVMATALDKLHRRLKALETMMSQSYYTQWSLEAILSATEQQCGQALLALQAGLENSLADVRQGIAGGGVAGSELARLLSHLVASTAAHIKKQLATLQVFVSSGCTYSGEMAFRGPFIVRQVREGTIIGFLRHLTTTLADFAGSSGGSASLVLVLARAAWDLHTSTAHYLLRECDVSLGVPEAAESSHITLTSTNAITQALKVAAQDLLNGYVARQGAALAQLLVRSVELKDWLGCGEPRSVRRVMRTVREDIETSEAQVGALYEEGTRKDRSSDSSRRTYHSLSASRSWSSTGRRPNTLNLSKLWSDRIEIFSPVTADKLSITTGIVKIALKSLEECLRLRTLGRYGLQQVQVDVHYLRTHLWGHVTDDTLLEALLDEVMTAAALRCNDAQLMEHSVLEYICEQ